MAQFLFSALTDGQHLAFDLNLDTLRFDGIGDQPSAAQVASSRGNFSLTFQGKTIWLDGVTQGLLSLKNFDFGSDAYLIFGDGTIDRVKDAYGQYYTLELSTTGNQIWGLDGADFVATGVGPDLLIGNVPLAPLNHVSRAGAAGSTVGSVHASVSADGRFVAFDGDWTGFGTEGLEGIIVKDMNSGALSDEHRSAGGVHGGSGAGGAVISADGRFVAFLSASSNLVSGPSSGALYDIYVAEVGGTGIVRASTGTGGALATDGRALNPDISATGRWLVFESDSSGYAAGGSTSQTDIFLKDLQTGSLTRISTSTTGGDGNGESINAHVSADGDFVVFQSAASNLVSGDGNGYTDIFLWEAATGQLTNISALLAPVSNPNNGNFRPDVAYYGDENAIVVFETGRNLVAADTSNGTDVYAYNFRSGALQLVSSKADGSGVQLSSGDASISDDGRWVVFTSASDALVPGDANGTADIFVKDLYTGAIALVSKSAAGVAANGPSGHARISSGGDWIVFESSASNLAATDANGGFTDVFRVANPLLRDTLQGGAGNDTYVLDREDVVIEAAGRGIDTVRASISYTLPAHVENLVLTGSANLNGTGNGLANVITGNAGANRIAGGNGIDTASYANATGPVTVNLAVTATQATGFGNDRLTSIENLEGSAFADRLTGNAGDNRLDGGAGADTLIGGEGSDTYVVGSSTDIVSETGTTVGDIDSVISSVGWTLAGTLENLTLVGTAPIHGNGNGRANLLTGNDAANAMDAGGGDDTVRGGAGNDNLKGGAGNDRLDGGAGSDTLAGGEGSDTYVVDASTDIISETGTTLGDVDTVISAVDWTLGATLERLTLTGTVAVRGNGNGSANVLTGNAAGNSMNGGGGSDTISGGDGNDTLTGGSGSDRLTGGSGADRFVLGSLVGSDTVTDFASGVDRVGISQSSLRVGDGDLLVEGATVRGVIGGFSATAELVIFTGNLSSLDAASAAAGIGSATSAIAAGRTMLFVVDNGGSSAVYHFSSADGDAVVEAAELTLLATIQGVPALATADLIFVA